jgi:hypothetical protein
LVEIEAGAAVLPGETDDPMSRVRVDPFDRQISCGVGDVYEEDDGKQDPSALAGAVEGREDGCQSMAEETRLMWHGSGGSVGTEQTIARLARSMQMLASLSRPGETTVMPEQTPRWPALLRRGLADKNRSRATFPEFVRKPSSAT